MLGLLVGLMTPLSVLVTSSQPACAVFLSDREEGTAETLLTTRVPRSALAAGKIAAVASLLGLSAVANLVLLWAACMQALSVLSEDLVIVLPTVAGAGVAVLALGTYSLLLTLFLTTMLVPLKTYKEGQNIGSTASLSVMAPLMVGAFAMMDVPAPWMWWAPMIHTPLLVDAALRSAWTASAVARVLGVDLLVAALWIAMLWRVPGPTGLVVGAWRPAWLDRLLGSDT
jgi:ABC-type Na+ efflux pump permease subunit